MSYVIRLDGVERYALIRILQQDIARSEEYGIDPSPAVVAILARLQGEGS